MENVYAVFSGEYSDWRVHGFFEDKVEAQKYCAIKNKDGWNNEYYVIALDKIQADVSAVKLYYHHEVVFDFKNGTFVMREEPDRYSFYSGKKKENELIYNTNNAQNWGWVAIKVSTKERKKAEKIAQDIVTQLHSVYIETGNFVATLTALGFKRQGMYEF